MASRMLEYIGASPRPKWLQPDGLAQHFFISCTRWPAHLRIRRRAASLDPGCRARASRPRFAVSSACDPCGRAHFLRQYGLSGHRNPIVKNHSTARDSGCISSHTFIHFRRTQGILSSIPFRSLSLFLPVRNGHDPYIHARMSLLWLISKLCARGT